jgi:hypothetical protein
MPVAKGHRGELPWVMRYYLANGDLPRSDEHHGFCHGSLDAFLLQGRWLTYQVRARQPDVDVRVVDELHDLWDRHRDEIIAATPAGERPWVQEALRAAGRL